MVKAEVISGVPERYLDIIELTDNIVWEEKGEEFILDDVYYDVIRTEVRNGKTYLYCLNDEHEEELIRNFALRVRKSADNEKRKNQKITVYSPLLQHQVVSSVCFKSPDTYKLIVFCDFKSAIASCYKEIVIPPPRQVV